MRPTKTWSRRVDFQASGTVEASPSVPNFDARVLSTRAQRGFRLVPKLEDSRVRSHAHFLSTAYRLECLDSMGAEAGLLSLESSVYHGKRGVQVQRSAFSCGCGCNLLLVSNGICNGSTLYESTQTKRKTVCLG